MPPKGLFGDRRLSALRQEEIERWYAGRQAAVRTSTVNKELARLKHLLGRAVAWGYLKASPATKLRKAKERPGRVRYLDPEERAVLLEGRAVTVTVADGRTWTAQRAPSPVLRAYIVAALQTGARRSELARLTRADVDWRAGRHRYLPAHEERGGPDGPPDRHAPGVPPGPAPVTRPGGAAPPHARPHGGLAALARGTSGRSASGGLTFHDLRHDAASTLTMAGVPQRTVMAILGHKDPRMTMPYQHLSPGHLRDAMRALEHPPATSAAPQAEAR